MHSLSIGRALLLASVSLPQIIAAQTDIAIDSAHIAPTSQCELHVWHSGELRSVYQGWFHGGIVDGAVKGRDGYPRIPENPLDGALQHRLLGEMDLRRALDLPNYTTILHDEMPDSRTVRAGTRLTQSKTACYAEFIADDVFLQQDDVSGNYLKTLFRFRIFGGGDLPERSFGTWAKTRLKQFPPQKGAPMNDALEELDAAYKSNVLVFGGYLNKPAPKKK